MEIKIKKLDERAVMPTKAFPTDAGFDMTAISMEYDEYGNIVYGFGWAFDIPEGYVGLLLPRSSCSKFDVVMPNSLGVIDSGFHGEVKAKFRPTSAQPVRGAKTDCIEIYQCSKADIFKIGDAVAQMVIVELPKVEFQIADELPKSLRGEGGWGHTGRCR